ncbi:hypothetical protein [Arenimonas composti]|uniref:Phage holin family protein n=1 Tax=Arenimonas composti TR7-09 = DSM 18010 TaxID=1121013 RepID=A0A091C0I1_9GAMM|nr:hypothetical protein [Arenimonas composti]KFN50140.1 hypothetical protein P873_08175 [Arenimonas composti TR7-09 = DSM 18010]
MVADPDTDAGELPPDSPAAPDPEPDPAAPGAAGPLAGDALALLASAKGVVAAYTGHLKALQRLFVEEVALARDAVVQAMVFLLLGMVLLAIVLGLLTVLAVVGLHWAGLSWPLAVLVPLALCAVLAVLAFLRARALFRYADFEGTRRQLGGGLAVPKEAEEE